LEKSQALEPQTRKSYKRRRDVGHMRCRFLDAAVPLAMAAREEALKAAFAAGALSRIAEVCIKGLVEGLAKDVGELDGS